MAIEIVDFPMKNGDLYGFVWKCWVNIPNEIAVAIFHRDHDQQNHWV